MVPQIFTEGPRYRSFRFTVFLDPRGQIHYGIEEQDGHTCEERRLEAKQNQTLAR